VPTVDLTEHTLALLAKPVAPITLEATFDEQGALRQLSLTQHIPADNPTQDRAEAERAAGVLVQRGRSAVTAPVHSERGIMSYENFTFHSVRLIQHLDLGALARDHTDKRVLQPRQLLEYLPARMNTERGPTRLSTRLPSRLTFNYDTHGKLKHCVITHSCRVDRGHVSHRPKVQGPRFSRTRINRDRPCGEECPRWPWIRARAGGVREPPRRRATARGTPVPQGRSAVARAPSGGSRASVDRGMHFRGARKQRREAGMAPPGPASLLLTDRWRGR
jgi:hypothetical protein